MRKPKWWNSPITWGQSCKLSLISIILGLIIWIVELICFKIWDPVATFNAARGWVDDNILRRTKEEADWGEVL